MNFNQRVLEANQKLFDLITTTNITFLNSLNDKIKIIKDGKFIYFKSFLLDINSIENFLIQLDSDKIYTLIPILSINDRKDQPFIVLSQQILVTKFSNPKLLYNFIDEKVISSKDLFNINNLDRFNTVLKYKAVEFDFLSYKKF
jgi:hypothetical protein